MIGNREKWLAFAPKDRAIDNKFEVPEVELKLNGMKHFQTDVELTKKKKKTTSPSQNYNQVLS